MPRETFLMSGGKQNRNLGVDDRLPHDQVPYFEFGSVACPFWFS
jgi:hypothetical protein